VSRLDAHVELARDGFRLDAALTAPARQTTSLVGPSGAGKTTLLRCLAGLEPSARGRIVVDGEVWLDGARSVPTHRRRIGYVFQEASLFAHLDVRGNLRFGEQRVPRAERRVAFDDVVGWLELTALLERRVEGLSGGERQRVALGRALLASPRLVLVDEPLSALDAAARERVLPWLAALPERIDAPVVHVSHSLREVARLAHAIVHLVDGRVVAAGPSGAMLPVVGAADDELGVALAGRVLEHDDTDGLTAVSVANQTLWVRRLAAPAGRTVHLYVSARDVALARAPDQGSSILNELPCTVDHVHPTATGAVVTLRLGDGAALYARITLRSLRLMGLGCGEPVFARVKGVGVAIEPGPEPRA